jgi:hypothetical protein
MVFHESSYLTRSSPRAKLDDRMSPDLSIALCLRDDENRLAAIAKAAVTVAEALAREFRAGEWTDSTREEPPLDRAPPDRGDLDVDRDLGPSIHYELIALDESSRLRLILASM